MVKICKHCDALKLSMPLDEVAGFGAFYECGKDYGSKPSMQPAM